MRHDEAVGLALAFVALASASVNIVLYKPFARVLTHYCMNSVLARFWGAFTRVMTVLLPVTVILFAATNTPEPSVPDYLYVMKIAKWGLLTLVGTLVVSALGVVLCGSGQSVPVWVEPEQAQDLQRLLERVREVRAREIVRRADHR